MRLRRLRQTVQTVMGVACYGVEVVKNKYGAGDSEACVRWFAGVRTNTTSLDDAAETRKCCWRLMRVWHRSLQIMKNCNCFSL